MDTPEPRSMSPDELVELATALPELEAQKRFLGAHSAGLDDQCAEAFKKQADHYLRADVQRSLDMAKLILYQAELTGNPLHRALGLLAEANARSIALGEYQRGLDLYDEAASIYEAHGQVVRQARSQVGKLVSLARLGRYEEALATGAWASRVLEEQEQWRPLADLTLNLGFIQSRIGRDVESLRQYDRAHKFYSRLGAEGEPFLPWVDHDRAIALRNLGRFDEALQAAQCAMETLAALGQTVETARARQNLALTYFVLGRYNEALVQLDQARDVFVADGRERDAILVELFISDCLLQLRRFRDVLEKCRQIRDLFAELGTRFEVGQAILNEAMAYAGLQRYEEAIDSVLEARRLFAQEGNRMWIACADLEMAALLLRQGFNGRSLETARVCAELFYEQGLPVWEARAHLIGARARAALSQHDEAHRLVSKTLAVARSRDIPSLAYQGHYLLGKLAVAEGDVERALTEYDQAIEELERLRGRLMIEFRADFLEDKQVIYEDVVDLKLGMDRPVQALEYAERAKSRALLDLLVYRLDLSVQAKTEADRTLLEEVSRLRAERDRLYRRWEGREEATEVDWSTTEGSRQQTRREVLDLEKQITDLWHRILIRNADYARDASLWQVRTEPVQPYLGPETILLEYFVAHDRLVAFVIFEQGVQVKRLPCDLQQVQHMLQLLWLNLRAVARSAPDQMANLTQNAKGLLKRLHEYLVEPLGEVLAPYPRLIIVPHGPLHYLPFHALYDGNSYLLEQHEISYLPAASLLRYCREAQTVDSGFLILGDNYGGQLPYAVQEACSVAELLGGRAYVEGEATLERLRREAPRSHVVHVATHGDFRSDNPLFSGLALADGWLTTLDIFGMRLRASLVTLSACQTGRNVVGGGDEVQGLMRAFVQAGTASVALTLWSVEDRSTAVLMEAFYGKLAEGWTKGAALQHAQRKLAAGKMEGVDTSTPYAHPYFWAPFFLVGDAGYL
jgi:CHAT domain-containing protein